MTIHCDIGIVERLPDGTVSLTIRFDGDISRGQMVKAIQVIDRVAAQPAPLLVDASLPHSIAFDAMIEMGKAEHVSAVAIYAPSAVAKVGADHVTELQALSEGAPYPFRSFADLQDAKRWLRAPVEPVGQQRQRGRPYASGVRAAPQL